MMAGPRIYFFLLLIFAQFVSFHVCARPLKERKLESQEIPLMLFHWTSANSLNDMAQRKSTMKTISPHSVLGSAFPGLVNKPGLFTWENPSAVAQTKNEIYAITENGIPPRLLALRLTPTVRGAIVTSHFYDKKASIPENVDVLLHIHYERGRNGWGEREAFREWVILNPKVVESYSASHHDLAPILRTELDHLRNSNFQYRPEEVHSQINAYGNGINWNDTQVRNTLIIPVLEASLNNGDKGVPPFFTSGKPAIAFQKKNATCRDALIKLSINRWNAYPVLHDEF